MHKEFIREVPGSPVALLFVHGIIGTPDHFSPLIPLLPGDVTVMNILLEGHGGSVRDFACASMKKWETQVNAALEKLCREHPCVLAVGHSMGCLLLMDAAKSYPRLRSLFLLAAPVVIGPKPLALVSAMKVIFDRIGSHDELAKSSRDSCSIKLERNLLKYLSWVPRYLELFRKSGKVRKQLGSIRLPCTALQSGKDELVSFRSCRQLRKDPKTELTVLPGSRHFYYSPADLDTLLREFTKWYTENTEARP